MSNVVTPSFRVSWPNIFKAKKNELNGKEEYSLVALFKKGEDLAVLKAAVQAVVEVKWGKDKKKWPALLKLPFRDQAERAKTNDDGKTVMPAGYEEGAIFITLKSAQRPGVVDQKVQPILDPSEIYAGCFCRATVRAYTYDQKGNRGVAFGLQNIQKVKDGDPISGKSRAEDDFSSVVEEVGNSGSAESVFL